MSAVAASTAIDISPIARFKAFYRDLDMDRLGELGDFYADDVIFCDPVGQVNGLREVHRYFSRLCANLDYCRFHYEAELVNGSNAVIVWNMEYAHPRLAGGKPLTLPGVTHLVVGEKIVMHRDYFDLGAMCYEHLPLFGHVTKVVKKQLGH